VALKGFSISATTTLNRRPGAAGGRQSSMIRDRKQGWASEKGLRGSGEEGLFLWFEVFDMGMLQIFLTGG
jgi:hypothetical protein